MSRKKIVLIVVGSVVALGAVAAGLAFMPAVQTWAARRILADVEGAEVTVDRVAAGLGSAHISGVALAQPGLIARIERIEVEYSAIGYLTSGQLQVSRLVVSGIDADFRAPAASGPGASPPAPAPAAPVRPPASDASAEVRPGSGDPFRGVLAEVVLPVDLRLDQLAIDGRARLDDTRTAEFAVTGGGVAAGAEARLNYRVGLTDATTGAPLRSLQTEGALTLALDANRMAAGAGVQARLTAEGEGVPREAFALQVSARRAEGGRESYSASLARGASASSPLVALAGNFDPAAGALSGDWTVSLPREALAALAGGMNLPELAANGSGTFAFATATGATSAAGELRGELARLAALSPELASIGPVTFASAFAVQADADALRIERLSLAVADEAGAPLLEVSNLQSVGFALGDQTLSFADPAADVARVSVRAVPLAWVQPWAAPYTLQGGEISLALDVTAAADGSRIEARAADPLSVRNLTVHEEGRALVEGLTLTVYPTISYHAGAASARLDRLELATAAGDALRGSIDVSAAGLDATPATDFAGKLEGRLAALHRPYLPVETGPLTLSLDFAGRHAGDELDLGRLSAVVGRDGAGVLADVTLRAPVKVDLARTAFAGSPGLAATVKLGEVPLAWLQPFVEGFAFAGEVTGGSFEVVMASPEDLTANTLAPLTLRGVTVSQDGGALAKDLELTTDFTATWRNQRLTYDVRDLAATQAGAALLRAKVAGQLILADGNFEVNGRGSFTADAAAISRQPAAAAYATLARGRLAGDFDASYGETVKAQASFTVREAIARAGNQALGDVDLSLKGEFKADGSGTLEAPLKVVAGGRASDLVLAGSYRRTEQGLHFDGKVSGQQVVVDDLQAFTVLAPVGEPVPPPAPSSGPARPATPSAPRSGAPATPSASKPDAQPFWSGVTGRLAADLAVVRYGPDTVVNGLKGVFVIAENRLALETFEGRLKEDPFTFSGSLAFAAGQPRPYALAGSVNVKNLDLGSILAAANPREKPTVETKVTAAGTLTGQGATLDDVLQRMQGNFDVKGGAGVLRALGRRGEAVGAVSGLLGLAGALSGSASTTATAELASQLNELRFDSMTMKVERGADLNLKVVSMEFLSPTTRLTGSGTVRHQEDVPLSKQPMNFQFLLAGKGALAQVLDRVGFLSGQQDEREYYTARQPLAIGGTPMSTDTRDLWSTILQTAIRIEIERRNAAAARRQAEEQAARSQPGAPQPQSSQPR